MSSRTQNAKRNIFSTLIYKLVGLGLAFGTRTVLLYYLGDLYLGLNGLFSSILQILSLAELGFGSAMVFSMYKPLAEDDRPKVCALLNLYRRIYRLIGFGILAVGLVLMPFLPKLIKGEVPSDVNLYILYLINLFNIVISYFLYAYKSSLLTANQRTDLISMISTIMTIATYALQILLLIVFRSFYLYSLVMPFITVSTNLINNYLANKLYPQFQCVGEVPTEAKADIKKRVMGLFVYKISSVFRNSFDSVVLSAFMGLAVLAKYNMYYYILSSVSGIISMLADSITAIVGNSVALEDQKKNYRDFRMVQLLYLGCSGICTALMIALYQPFMELWGGTEMMFSDRMMYLFCIYFFSLQIGVICYIYRQAVGLWWQDRIRPVIEAFTNLALNFILVNKFGVSGVMLSTIFCVVFINTGCGAWVLFRHYFTNQKMKEYFGRLLIYCALTAADCFICALICPLLPLTGIAGLVARGIAALLISALIFGIGLLPLPEFSDALSLIKGFLRRKATAEEQ